MTSIHSSNIFLTPPPKVIAIILSINDMPAGPGSPQSWLTPASRAHFTHEAEAWRHLPNLPLAPKLAGDQGGFRIQVLVAAEPCSSIHRVFHPGGDASVRDPPWAPRPVKSKVRLELPAHWGVHPTPSRRVAGIRQARQPCLDAGSSCRRPSREKSIKGTPGSRDPALTLLPAGCGGQPAARWH